MRASCMVGRRIHGKVQRFTFLGVTVRSVVRVASIHWSLAGGRWAAERNANGVGTRYRLVHPGQTSPGTLDLLLDASGISCELCLERVYWTALALPRGAHVSAHVRMGTRQLRLIRQVSRSGGCYLTVLPNFSVGSPQGKQTISLRVYAHSGRRNGGLQGGGT